MARYVNIVLLQINCAHFISQSSAHKLKVRLNTTFIVVKKRQNGLVGGRHCRRHQNHHRNDDHHHCERETLATAPFLLLFCISF